MGKKTVYSDDKNVLKSQINNCLNILCTGVANKCPIPTCNYYNKCYKEENPTESTRKNMRLRAILKNLRNTVNKVKGRVNPNYLGDNHFQIAETILGQPVLEHELIKGNFATMTRIKRCTTLNQILLIMERRNKELNSAFKFHDNPYYGNRPLNQQ